MALDLYIYIYALGLKCRLSLVSLFHLYTCVCVCGKLDHDSCKKTFVLSNVDGGNAESHVCCEFTRQREDRQSNAC